MKYFILGMIFILFFQPVIDGISSLILTCFDKIKTNLFPSIEENVGVIGFKGEEE